MKNLASVQILQMGLNKKFIVPTTSDLVKSIPKIRREWKWMSPIQKWCYLYGIGKSALNPVKMTIFFEKLEKIHWFGYFALLYIGTIFILSIYTFYYFISRGDLFSCLPCTCMAGVFLAVCIIPQVDLCIVYIYQRVHFFHRLCR